MRSFGRGLSTNDPGILLGMFLEQELGRCNARMGTTQGLESIGDRIRPVEIGSLSALLKRGKSLLAVATSSDKLVTECLKPISLFFAIDALSLQTLKFTVDLEAATDVFNTPLKEVQFKVKEEPPDRDQILDQHTDQHVRFKPGTLISQLIGSLQQTTSSRRQSDKRKLLFSDPERHGRFFICAAKVEQREAA